MDAPHHSRTFRSGNSEAVRLPKELGFGIGTDIVVERQGENVILRPAKDANHARLALKTLVADLEAIGRPADGVQARPEFGAPVRPGL
jgi:antitoxin VapB